MSLNHVVTYQVETGSETPVIQKSTNGAGHTHIKADDTALAHAYGDNLSIDVWGDPITKVVLPDGAGLGPSTFIVDMRNYGRAFFGIMPTTLTVDTLTVAVAWSKAGTAGTTHSSTTEINAVAGNNGFAMTIKDNFAHITLSASASNAVYAYITGRELV